MIRCQLSMVLVQMRKGIEGHQFHMQVGWQHYVHNAHWGALKWILRYLNSFLSSNLRLKRKLHDRETIKGWRSILQLVVAKSTTQVEFIAFM
ncbi:hypothetical protein CR513_25350, partial [Mucuna pruriens]